MHSKPSFFYNANSYKVEFPIQLNDNVIPSGTECFPGTKASGLYKEVLFVTDT